MKKKLVALTLAMAFALGTGGAAFAARVKCTVESVDGNKVMMTCEKADKFTKGDTVKVIPKKKGAGIEGC